MTKIFEQDTLLNENARMWNLLRVDGGGNST